MGMESTLKNSAFLAVFVIAIITFGILFASNNGSDITIGDDSRLTGVNSTIRTDLSNLEGNADDSQSYALATTLEAGDEHQGSGAQFKVGPYEAMKMSVTAMGSSFSLLFGGDNDGSNPFGFIPILFATVLTFLIGYYIIKAWLGRDPE